MLQQAFCASEQHPSRPTINGILMKMTCEDNQEDQHETPHNPSLQSGKLLEAFGCTPVTTALLGYVAAAGRKTGGRHDTDPPSTTM